LNELGNSPRFLGEPDKADPNWVLERTFQVTGDVAFCGAGELPASCTDAFIARTQALAEE
jgi:hypothetical protein